MSLDRLIKAYLAHRYALLFYSLLLTLGAGPFLAALDIDRNLIRFFLEVNVFAAVLGVSGMPRWRLLPFLFVLIIAARLVAFAFDAQALAAATGPLVIAIVLMAAAGALRFAMTGRRIDAEHIYAALGAYLLAGVFCGVLYHQIEQAWPGSFLSGGETVADFSLATAIYFSFVTLATLGYGDLVPRSEVARGVAIVEAVAGQLYLAVMVARLVSIYARPVKQEA